MKKENENKAVKTKNNKSTKVRSKTVNAKCKVCNKPFSYNPDEAEEGSDKATLCKECFEKKNRIAYRATCIECGKPFYLRGGAVEWLNKKGFEMPKRCFECRSYRKIMKAKSENSESKTEE